MNRQAARCTARRSSDGEPCKNFAMNGAKVCHAHGGRSPQVRRRAAERVAEREAARAMEAYRPLVSAVENPVDELLKLAGEIKQFKDYLGGRVAEMRAESWRFTDDKGAEQLRAELALYERALDRTERVMARLVQLGLEERLVRISERQGRQFADALHRILAELDLSNDQQARVPKIVPRVLRTITGEVIA